MFETSRDLLYVVLSLAIIWFTVFLCWLLYQAGRTLRNLNRILETALEKIVMSCRELRSSADISNFTSTQFSFVENNGNADNVSLSGSTILLNSQTLLNNVSSLTFSYYDKNGIVTNTQNNIRYIQISLQLGGNTSSIGLTTTVFPRVFTS